MSWNWHVQQVSVRDLDGFGHVNNSVYLTYIENGRVAYYMDVIGVAGLDEINNLIASVEIDFRRQIDFPAEVRIGVRVTRIGNRSFELEYVIEADGEIAAEARSVQVVVDPDSGETVPVPEQWRRRIEEFGIAVTGDSEGRP